MGYDDGLDSFDGGLDSGSDSSLDSYDSGSLDSFGDSSLDSLDSGSLDSFGDSSLDSLDNSSLDSLDSSSLDSVDNFENSSIDIVDSTNDVPIMDSFDTLEVNDEQPVDAFEEGKTLDVVPNDISDELDTLDAIEDNPVEAVETEATENMNYFENNDAINLEKDDTSGFNPETSGEMLKADNPYQEKWENFYEEMNGETIEESANKWDSLSEVPFAGDDNQLDINNTDVAEDGSDEGPQKVLKLTPTGSDMGYPEKTFLEESQEEYDQIVSDENLSNAEKIDQLNDLKDNLEIAKEQELEDSYNNIEGTEVMEEPSDTQEYQDTYEQIVDDESLSNEEKIDQLTDLKDDLTSEQEQGLEDINNVEDTDLAEEVSDTQEYQETYEQIVNDESLSNEEKIDQLTDLKDDLTSEQEQGLEDINNLEDTDLAEEVSDTQEYQETYEQIVNDESLSNEEKINQLNDLKDDLNIAKEQELENSYDDINNNEVVETPSETQEYQNEGFEETNESEDVNENIEDVSSWLNEINPNFDEFDVDSPYSNNCGSCAFAVYNRLEGTDTDICATAENIPTNEAMEAATGLEMQSSTPADIEKMLLDQGDGAHAIIGVDRAEGPGHWFNAAVIDGKVYAIDGQSGQLYDWPPDYGDVVHWDVSVKKEM